MIRYATVCRQAAKKKKTMQLEEISSLGRKRKGYQTERKSGKCNEPVGGGSHGTCGHGGKQNADIDLAGRECLKDGTQQKKLLGHLSHQDQVENFRVMGGKEMAKECERNRA